MSDYVVPKAPDIEAAYRAAYRALEPIVSGAVTPETQLGATGVISEFPHLVEQAGLAVAAQLGPVICWRDAKQDDLALVLARADLDHGRHFGPTLSSFALSVDGPLVRAARVYRRQCEWPQTPGLDGIWLLMLAPVTVIDWLSEQWRYRGHLAGFLILYDRDEDGKYESIGHIWTAKAWRRRGIARRLLHEARSRFGATKFEGPFSEDGAAFVEATRQPDTPAD
jgi:ribosomal protein S18 acetylase RimI-like enzyme